MKKSSTFRQSIEADFMNLLGGLNISDYSWDHLYLLTDVQIVELTLRYSKGA